MHTRFTWCLPLKTKTADKVVTAHKNYIACPFGESIKILTDNVTEFKNELFKEVVTKLGTEMSSIQFIHHHTDHRATRR